MIPLFPPDTELTWSQVEAQIKETQLEAELIWTNAGILMPDEASQEIMLRFMDTALSETAETLGISLREVYALRNRILWFNSTDLPGESECYVSIDSNPPSKIKKQPTL